MNDAKAMKKLSLYRTVGNNKGILGIVVLMVMAIFLCITAASLSLSQLSLKASANLKGGTAALQAADAGIHHALAKIPAAGDFNTLLAGNVPGFPCVPSGPCDGNTKKPTLTGSLAGYAYTVEVTNDTTVGGETATNDTNKIVILTSTATGPTGSKRKVRAYIGRSPWLPPGTIYLPGAPTSIGETFTGSSFLISGNDTKQWQAVGSGSASPILGIATTDSGSTTEVTSTLGSSKYAEVTGYGSNPSIATSTALDVNQLATDLLNLNVSRLDLPADDYSTLDFGTSASNPKVVHIQGNTKLKCGSGNHPTAVGYGVLIVDGNLTTSGLFRWDGIIIVKGTTVSLHGSGGSDGATIWGTVLVKQPASSVAFSIGGNTKTMYNSEAIKLVTDKWGSAFSTNARIIAWNEMML